jgi:hypothetical protein
MHKQVPGLACDEVKGDLVVVDGAAVHTSHSMGVAFASCTPTASSHSSNVNTVPKHSVKRARREAAVVSCHNGYGPPDQARCSTTVTMSRQHCMHPGRVTCAVVGAAARWHAPMHL